MNSHNYKNLNEAAISVLPILLKEILPQGKIIGNEYKARNPTRSDQHLGSFSINMRNGCWGDFATGDFGRGAISLISYIERIDFYEAAAMLKKMLVRI